MKTLIDAPEAARAAYVLAHGAGAGMRHPFIQAIAEGLAARGVAVLRYEFAYMEQGGKRPDPPKVAEARVREAVEEAAHRFPGLPLFAGGKSFGGRMTSQAQAAQPLPGVHGLVFLGFPLHPTGKPSDQRAAHLEKVKIPMLFLQGTRDTLADLALLRPVVLRLGKGAALETLDEADHSFHVPARTGRKDAEVREELLAIFVRWIDSQRLPA